MLMLILCTNNQRVANYTPNLFILDHKICIQFMTMCIVVFKMMAKRCKKDPTPRKRKLDIIFYKSNQYKLVDMMCELIQECYGVMMITDCDES